MNSDRKYRLDYRAVSLGDAWCYW